jgi:hypothetical protein
VSAGNDGGSIKTALIGSGESGGSVASASQYSENDLMG